MRKRKRVYQGKERWAKAIAKYGQCEVEGCPAPKMKGNLKLCHYHYTGDVSADEVCGEGYLSSKHINMKEVKARIIWPSVTRLTAKDYTQEELEYYLKHGELPAQTERMAA